MPSLSNLDLSTKQETIQKQPSYRSIKSIKIKTKIEKEKSLKNSEIFEKPKLDISRTRQGAVHNAPALSGGDVTEVRWFILGMMVGYILALVSIWLRWPVQ